MATEYERGAERLLSGLAGMVLIGKALNSRNRPLRLSDAGAVALGVVLLRHGLTGSGIFRGMGLTMSDPDRGSLTIVKSILVNRDAGQLYSFWRDLRNIPQFMKQVLEVRELSPSRSYWRMRTPLGDELEWEADISSERQNEFLAWKSLPGSSLDTSGSVSFLPSAKGETRVTLNLHITPPAGMVGAIASTVLGQDPEVQAENDLKRFKQLMETGEVARTDCQPEGQRRTARIVNFMERRATI